MIYVEAPEKKEISQNLDSMPKIFLAGSITNAKDWQSNLIKHVENLNCIIYNPRRKVFDMSDKNESEIQINWEFKYLRETDIVIFYFSEETVAPITLFELGSRLESNLDAHYQSIYVYCEPNYPRKEDVKIQTDLMCKYFTHIQKIKSVLFLNPEHTEKIVKMEKDGPQEYGYDILYFENYNDFLKKLKLKIKSW